MFKKRYIQHFCNAGKYLVNKSTVNLPKLKCFKLLQSKSIEDWKNSCSYINELLNSFPSSFPKSSVVDEYKLLRFENLVEKTDETLDVLGAKFFQLKDELGRKKFPALEIFVKSILSVSHGNTDVERGFSSSALILTEERSQMSERTLNAHMNTLDTIKSVNKQVELIQIDKTLISMASSARKSHDLYLCNKKRKKI